MDAINIEWRIFRMGDLFIGVEDGKDCALIVLTPATHESADHISTTTASGTAADN